MASCNNFTNASSPITFDVQYFVSNQCFQCQDNGCGSNTFNSKCVWYAGPNLPCSGIETYDSLELALQKIDAQICSAIGDYANYQFNCLTAYWGSDITQESQFVDAITSYACSINDTINTFIDTTFAEYQISVTEQFDAITNPGITCIVAGVGPSDTLTTVLSSYCSAITTISDSLDVSGVTWDQCLTVITPPTTVSEAFSLVVDQICQVMALTSGALPTFNNTGTCLASPGTADTLVATIGKIITRVCLSPTWDASNVTWGCIATPSSDTDLEEAVQNIVDGINPMIQAFPTFDGGDFVVTPNNVSDPCAGVTVSLATPLNQDRFVASNALDSSPGTLADKLTAGTNVTLDYLTTPGQVIIAASGGTDSFTVKAGVTDASPGFLGAKINGGVDTGIVITASYNMGTQKVDILPSINFSDLFNALLDELDVDSELYTKFCEKVGNCPSPCDAPSSVQAIPNPTTTTTTTLP